MIILTANITIVTIIIIIISILLICGIYVAMIIVDAWLEVRNSPREPMYECPKHGILREKHLINFRFDNDQKPYQECPMCFDEKVHTKLDATVH